MYQVVDLIESEDSIGSKILRIERSLSLNDLSAVEGPKISASLKALQSLNGLSTAEGPKGIAALSVYSNIK